MIALSDAMTRQWRVAWLSIAAAGFSISAVVTSVMTKGLHWSLVLPGFVIGVAGYQVHAALRMTRRVAPDRVGSWMVALANLLYVLGGVCIAMGLWALAHRGAAI